MHTVNIHEAKTHLSRLLNQAHAVKKPKTKDQKEAEMELGIEFM